MSIIEHGCRKRGEGGGGGGGTGGTKKWYQHLQVINEY